jgi:hypothetical protein
MVEVRPPDPERLIVVPRIEGDDGTPRYLFMRWSDWPPPAMLSVARPSEEAALGEAVASALQARMSVECVGEPCVSATRLPVRMPHPRMGGDGPGWLRAVAVRVRGEPRPDALIDEVVALPLEEALEQLTTEVERQLVREGAALFDLA